VHEAHKRGSVAGEIIKTIMEEDAAAIKKPVKVLGALNTPIGSAYYEYMILPKVEDIIAAAEELTR
ncbi:MAG TPA: alpha-ketoacid dehydrogenase subunit beta, partial [Syntrophomonas sp.]|nr:alpha-ketoacid dehydrogenase subunit beta [Syntrophomonas sp.]